MLKWDVEVLTRVLGVQPVFNENSSYTFRFHFLGFLAELDIYPYTNEIRLLIPNPEATEPVFGWYLICSEIQELDDDGSGDEAEDAVGVAFIPLDPRQQHSITISRLDDHISFFTCFPGDD